MLRVYSKFNWIEDVKILAPYKILLEKYPHCKFIWLDAYQYEHEIEYMNTSHLYYTVRMIWNYLCNDDLVIDTKIDYDFSSNPIYCDDYFKLGLKEILSELKTRKDLGLNFKKNLCFISENIGSI